MNSQPEPLQSLDQVISTVLKTPFTPTRIAKHRFTPKELQSLAFAVQDYYRKTRLPTKSEYQLRPYISPLSLQGWGLGLGYVFSEKHFDTQRSYKFAPAISGEMTRNIKKYLLYCHGVCIHDPLPYLLDYFRLAPDDETALVRLPAVKSLLVEYAGLARLINERIVIPVADEMLGIRTTVFLTDEEREFLRLRLFQLGKDVEIIGSAIRDEQAKIARLQNQADLFLPHSDFIPVLRELLHYSETKFTSRQIREPFNVGILEDISAINPDEVTIDDIAKIRRNDELFSEFRAILAKVFEQLYHNRNDYTDLDREFTDRVRDGLSQWKDKVSTKRKESSFTNRALESSEKILIGIIGGAVSGLITAGPPGAMIGAVAGAVVPPALESITDFLRIAWNRPIDVTLRRHFLAIQGDK